MIISSRDPRLKVILQVNDPLSMFSGDMMTVNVNLSGLPVSSNARKIPPLKRFAKHLTRHLQLFLCAGHRSSQRTGAN